MSVPTSGDKPINELFDIDIPISEVVEILCYVTSRRLVAVTTGVTSAETVTNWKNQKYSLDDSQKSKLFTMYNIVKMLQDNGEDDISIYAFLIGRSPELDDLSPAEAIRAGNFSEAWAAAKNVAING